MSIQPGGKDISVVLATSKTKKQNKPGSLYNRSVMKKEFRKMAKAVKNQVPFVLFFLLKKKHCFMLPHCLAILCLVFFYVA